MAVVPNDQKMLATCEFSKVGKCCVRLLPSCSAMTWVPTAAANRTSGQASSPSRSRHTVCRSMFWRRARRPCYFLCLWRGTQHQVSMCKSGADAQTCAAQQRAPPHRLTRSQKTGISAEILVLRSAALPSTAVSRALARNMPRC